VTDDPTPTATKATGGAHAILVKEEGSGCKTISEFDLCTNH